LDQNGVIVQKGNTGQMLWNCDELIYEISKYFTLKIGDIIFTGTPAGVGKVDQGDNLEGFVNNNSIFKINIK